MRGKDAARSPAAGGDFSQREAHARTFDEAPTPSPACDASFSVAGVLVHAYASAADDIAARIRELPGAAVHGSAAGKLAITLESQDAATIIEQLTQIQRMPGVLSAALVSEHSAPLDTIDEELTDE